MVEKAKTAFEKFRQLTKKLIAVPKDETKKPKRGSEAPESRRAIR